MADCFLDEGEDGFEFQTFDVLNVEDPNLLIITEAV